MKPRPRACAVPARRGIRETGLVGFQARTTRARPGYEAGLTTKYLVVVGTQNP